MATAESHFLEKIHQNFVVCVICSERYKTAKVLPCLHSFCEQCLRDLVEKTGRLDCPVCRRSHQLPEGGVTKLQTNIFLDQLVEQFNQHEHEPSKSACDGCMGEGGDSDVGCVECSMKLCKICARTHKRIPATRSHRLIPVEEYLCMKSKDPAMAHASVYCDRHADSQVKFYCDTCEVPICSDCTVIDHRIPEHKHRCLQDAAGEYKEVVGKTIDELKVKENEARASKAAVQKMMNMLDTGFNAEEKKLQNHVMKTIEEITKRIEENCKQLLKQLKDEYEVRKDDLTAQLKTLDIIEHDIANTQEFAENLILYGNATQLMSSKKNLAAQTQELMTVETDCYPVADDFMMFQPYDDFCDRKSLGTVHLTDFTLQDVPEYCRIGEDVRVTVAMKRGKLVSKNEIKAEMIPDEVTQKETMTIEDYKKGTVTFRCPANVEREQKVVVSVGEQVICSSTIKVIPQKGFLFTFGKEGRSEDKMSRPWGLTLDRDGNIIVCDYAARRGDEKVRLYEFKGKRGVEMKRTEVCKGFYPQYNTAMSRGQNSYLATAESKRRVFVFDDSLKLLRSFKGNMSRPKGIAVNQTNGYVYIADDSSGRVHIFDRDDGEMKSFGRKEGNFKSPEGVCVSRDGNVIVSDSGNHCIEVFDADGEFLFTFGSAGSGPGQFQNPHGVTTDKLNNVYVCDRSNKRVLKFDPKGNYICRVDNGEVTDPIDVCVTDDEPFGKVIVSDCDGDCVKVFAQ
ncbi:E3 ubiquitin-protein ligase TRIM71-like [Ptychodera flava]|uniref:E3 ubiquitin-protein ligase TRIM71-like n=1 Tax=Ptychodera flava TaxID=63121 RepID=UPI003969EF4E